MNKKKTLVLFLAMSSVLCIGTISLLARKEPIRINAANGKYSLDLNSSNAPELTNTPSSGSFVAKTGNGNNITFNYENLAASSGNIAAMTTASSLSNNTVITGIVSITVTFTGSMNLSYGLTRADAHVLTLTSGSETELPQTACYFKLIPTANANLTTLNIKYDCALSESAIDAREIETKRFELLESFEYPENEYRSDEIASIEAAAAPIIAQINDENATLADLNNISLAPFQSAVANAKKNAEYMVEEAFNYGHLSRWALVNEHAATWSYSGAEFKTPGMGGTDVGYITSPYLYQGGFEAVLKCNNSATTAADFGLVIGNDSTTGDGIDGYMLSWNYSVGDHMFLQVFKLLNGFGSANAVSKYIGGWIYNRGTQDLRNDDIKVIYNGQTLTLMNNNDYLNGSNEKVVVGLDNEGYSLAPGSTYRFGYLNWNGSSANSLQIKQLAMENPVNSNLVANQVADEMIGRYDLSMYSPSEKTQINAKIAEIDALRPAGTYAEIVSKVDELVALFASFKEAGKAQAKEVLDNMFAFGDATKSTPSNMDAVNTNVATWTHAAGTNSFTTNATAGYVMDAATHEDFMMVFKVNGVHNGNPYGNACRKGILLGTNVAGNYFNGIFLALSDDWGFQFHQLNSDGSSAFNTPAASFRGGFAVNTEGVTYKLVVKSGSVTVYSIDALGHDYRMAGVDGGFANTNVWNLSVPVGHVGFLSWEGVSTFSLLEFKDL